MDEIDMQIVTRTIVIVHDDGVRSIFAVIDGHLYFIDVNAAHPADPKAIPTDIAQARNNAWKQARKNGWL